MVERIYKMPTQEDLEQITDQVLHNFPTGTIATDAHEDLVEKAIEKFPDAKYIIPRNFDFLPTPSNEMEAKLEVVVFYAKSYQTDVKQ